MSSTNVSIANLTKPQVLTINVPHTIPGALPYGPAVVNGILESDGYKTVALDLSIELYNKFNDDSEYSSLLGIITAGYTGNYNTISFGFYRKIVRYIKERLIQHRKDYDPEIVTFSVFSSQSLDITPLVVTIARKIFPNSYFIIGGRGLDSISKITQNNHGELFHRYLPVDCVYLGDAENELLDIVNKRTNGVVYADPVNKEELLNTPKASWNGYSFRQYKGYDTGELYVPITASKGCVRKCTFCDVHSSWPKYIFRDGASVGNELVDLYNKSGMTRYEFTDNLVNGSASNWRAMNKTIADRLPNTLQYKGYAICRSKDAHPEEDFELAKRAGAELLKIGVESGSEKVRYDIRKKFTNDDLDWFATNCYKYDIKQTWLMFCGYPTETDADFEESIQLLTEYQYMAKNKNVNVFLSLPMMLTDLGNLMQFQDDAIENGLLHNHNDPMAVNFWTSTKYEWNTWPLRSDRFKRLLSHAYKLGYITSDRQKEKLIELEGLDRVYENSKHQDYTVPDSNFYS